jgi:hypothetical protein
MLKSRYLINLSTIKNRKAREKKIRDVFNLKKARSAKNTVYTHS